MNEITILCICVALFVHRGNNKLIALLFALFFSLNEFIQTILYQSELVFVANNVGSLCFIICIYQLKWRSRMGLRLAGVEFLFMLVDLAAFISYHLDIAIVYSQYNIALTFLIWMQLMMLVVGDGRNRYNFDDFCEALHRVYLYKRLLP